MDVTLLNDVDLKLDMNIFNVIFKEFAEVMKKEFLL